jgi:hypothetical protein
MKNLIAILTALLLFSCTSALEKENLKNTKQNNTSSRINSSQSNNDKILDELN